MLLVKSSSISTCMLIRDRKSTTYVELHLSRCTVLWHSSRKPRRLRPPSSEFLSSFCCRVFKTVRHPSTTGCRSALLRAVSKSGSDKRFSIHCNILERVVALHRYQYNIISILDEGSLSDRKVLETPLVRKDTAYEVHEWFLIAQKYHQPSTQNPLWLKGEYWRALGYINYNDTY